MLAKKPFLQRVQPHNILCQPQSLPGLALFAAIVTIHDQESSAMNKEWKLQITGSVADIPCSRRPAKLYTNAKAFIDQQMHKNSKMKIR